LSPPFPIWNCLFLCLLLRQSFAGEGTFLLPFWTYARPSHHQCFPPALCECLNSPKVKAVNGFPGRSADFPLLEATECFFFSSFSNPLRRSTFSPHLPWLFTLNLSQTPLVRTLAFLVRFPPFVTKDTSSLVPSDLLCFGARKFFYLPHLSPHFLSLWQTGFIFFFPHWLPSLSFCSPFSSCSPAPTRTHPFLPAAFFIPF